MAQFETPDHLLHVAQKLREAGYRQYECHSPFPIHGMDQATGEQPSRVSWVAGAGALLALIGAFFMQGWMSAVDYRHVVSGKPLLSYQAFFPITFALAVLFAAVGAVLAFLGFAQLHYYHPVFYSDRFKQFSDHAFFVSVEAADPKFDLVKTRELLQRLGGNPVEVLEGE